MAQVEFKLPELGNEVTEAQVDLWHAAVGDAVSEGEPLLSITTPKVTMDLDAPASGTLVSVHAEEDEVVNVGALLAVIET
ncbi:MAG: lipoyl domain-containing protein [Paracoccaceae bacterium]|nr:lipoyl domain-containing protein [Paracoccaceae bacterium]